MKVDRRSFLSFIIGGAAGTALSPLPWKLTDDLSIWSQNWPWTPAPVKGEVAYVNSVCTLCPGGCGITVRKVDDRVVKIEGLKGHPVNEGRLCNLGLAGAQLLYGPGRITSPLKKVGGRWQKIAWEAALAEISAKLAELRSKGQASSVACLCGSDFGTVPELLNRFLTVYGSPNFSVTASMQDNYALMLYLSQGVRALAGFDVAHADFVLSFGSGLIEGWGSPVYMFRAKSNLRESGGRMDQIEPRLSKTAAKADRWLPIKPGTEGALALGLAHVILQEKLYHQDFVANHTTGLEARQQKLGDEYAPAKVAQMTGVDASTITALARDFAGAERPLAICGRGAGSTPGSLNDFLAVHMLNALVGNLNQKGGIWAVPEPDYIEWPEAEMDETAVTGMQAPRVDGAGSDQYPHARYLVNRLFEVINSSSASPVQVLLVAGANPLYSQSNILKVQEALAKIPLKVSFSSYMDETAAHADLILPDHMYLERYEDVAVAAGFPQPIVGLVQPVVAPLHKTRHIGDVIIQLAQKLGGSIAAAFPWDNYEACLVETLADKWEILVEDGYWVDADFAPSARAAGFGTDSGKFEFTNA
ncbi:MAG: molybdopterin-dependent oxidoreductase, partial [Desulfobacterales bacterium]